MPDHEDHEDYEDYEYKTVEVDLTGKYKDEVQSALRLEVDLLKWVHGPFGWQVDSISIKRTGPERRIIETRTEEEGGTEVEHITIRDATKTTAQRFY